MQLCLCKSWQGTDEVKGFNIFHSKIFLARNETEPRKFAAIVSCVQLSPASKDAQWTIFTDKISNKENCVSLATPDGILLMGGNTRRGVNLLKPDGSYEYDVFELKRYIE